MFCPVGFAHFHEIEEICYEAADELVREENGSGNSRLEDKDRRTDIEYHRVNQRHIIETSLLGLFINDNPFAGYASSTDGQLFRLSPQAIRPFRFNHERKILFEKEFYPKPEFEYFIFLDRETGTLDPCGASERIANEISRGRLPAQWGDTWFPAMRLSLSGLQGWALCFNKSEVSINVTSFMELWLGKSAERPINSIADETDAYKRARAHFLSAGTEGVTKTQLQKQICPDLGTNAFARVWSKLRSEFPEIGRPGRRSIDR